MKHFLLTIVCAHWSYGVFYDEALYKNMLRTGTNSAEKQAYEFINSLPEKQRWLVQFSQTHWASADKVTVFYCDKVKEVK